MFILEYKLRGKQSQYRAIDEAIRTVQFVRNKCLRFWQDNRGIGQKDIYKYTTVLRNEIPFVGDLNSTACQQACERTWTAILKFYDNCKKRSADAPSHGESSAVLGSPQVEQLANPKGASPRTKQPISGKKGYPKYSCKTRSVEFKKSGWKLDRDRKRIIFTDGKNIGELKLIGSRDLFYFQEWQIQRVRIIRRADGYFVQLILKLDVRDITPHLEPTRKCVGIDVGLKYFYANSEGSTVECPEYYRSSEKRLNRLNRRKSKKFRKGKKPSNNYIKARKKYAKGHLKVSRQREEFAKRQALRLIQSNDLIAYEDLKVKNLVRNRKLAKSINDAAWSLLRKWIEYFGIKYGRLTIAVPPEYTSQDCFNCGKRIKKSLSVRTHVCSCGYVADRDINAALNILRKATTGHVGSWSEDLNAWGDLSSILVGGNTCSDKTGQ